MQESEDYVLLNHRSIIELLIDGEVFPYLTDDSIKDLGSKFGCDIYQNESFYVPSRVDRMTDILNYLHHKNTTESFLSYFLNNYSLSDKVKDIIRKNQNNEPVYEELSDILFESIDNNVKISNFLRNDMLNQINNDLCTSGKILNLVGNNVFISDLNTGVYFTKPNDSLTHFDIIDKLLKNSKLAFENNDYDSVITKSRTLLEDVFIKILEEHDVEIKQNGKISKYRGEVNKVLGMKTNSDFDKRINEMLTGVNKIIDSISAMRDNSSDAHGRSNKISINKAEAELVLNSSIMIANYYLRVNNRQDNNL